MQRQGAHFTTSFAHASKEWTSTYLELHARVPPPEATTWAKKITRASHSSLTEHWMQHALSIAVWACSLITVYCRWRNPWTIMNNRVLVQTTFWHVTCMACLYTGDSIVSFFLTATQYRNRYCTFIAPSVGLRLVHFNSCDAKLKIYENVTTGEAGRVTEECFPEKSFEVRKIVTNPSDPWHAFLVLSWHVRWLLLLWFQVLCCKRSPDDC